MRLGPTVGEKRRCDFAIRRNSSECELFVELTQAIETTQEQRRARAIMERVVPSIQLMMSGLIGGCRFERTPEPEEEDYVFERTDAFWKERFQRRDAGILVLEGVLSLWVAPEADEECKRSYEAQGMPTGHY